MNKFIRRYLKRSWAFISRLWTGVKRYDYRPVWQVLVGVMEILPGLIAWVIEVSALIASVICIVQAARQAAEVQLCAALILILISAMLVGIALLSDHYTRPRQSKQGGGS